MTSLFSKALVYLGLVDEDQAGENAADQISYAHDQPAQPTTAPDTLQQGRRVEPPPTARAATRPQVRSEVQNVQQVSSSSVVRPVEVQSDILVVEEFADARMLADRIRERVPVVLDMRHADGDLVRRVVDFSSGLIYALDGSMRKVGDGLVLVLPPRVTLSRDEKRRLASLNAYALDDIDD